MMSGLMAQWSYREDLEAYIWTARSLRQTSEPMKVHQISGGVAKALHYALRRFVLAP
jgi:hypothetical protein